MTETPFLTIGKQSISIGEALSYLNKSGELEKFLTKIIRQHILETELNSSIYSDIGNREMENYISTFREQNQLTDSQAFNEWLENQKLDLHDFQEKISVQIKLELLKTEVTQTRMDSYYENNKELFSRVLMSRIVVSNEELALKLKQQMVSGERDFEDLADQYSIVQDTHEGGGLQAIALARLPKPLQELVLTSSPGEILGPGLIDQRYVLLKVNKILPATLDDALRKELQEQMFEEWLQEKASSMRIEMHLS